MSKDNGKPLRFAALIRVSTEQQEKTGESLRTQRCQNEQDVAMLGGTIVSWYGGQEHATPGWEKKEVDRLIADAGRGKFDAVIVSNADRWSRDNVKSLEGIETFRRAKVRFYVSTSEYNLHDPEHVLFLDVSSVIGKFQARNQSKKSLLNRIARARRGLPTCGKLPFGRTFDKAKGWDINAKKKRMIEDVAKRYLAGEPLSRLATEYGINHANLHKILTKRCGENWEQDFRSVDLNIREVVPTPIPRLLPDETIKAIRQQAEANKTYQHRQGKNAYLFGRMVFCGHCGYAMFGQTNHNTRRYYRHCHTQRVKACAFPKAWVNAEELEEVVIRELFSCFGNPLAVRKAVEQATPNRERAESHRKRVEHLDDLLSKIATAKQRILRLIARDSVTEVEAERQLEDLKKEELQWQAERDGLLAELEHVPSAAKVKEFSVAVSARLRAEISHANHCLEDMPWDHKRSLAELVFGGKLPEGKRMGIYIEWMDGQEQCRRKKWRYTVHGHLIQEGGFLPAKKTPPDPEHGEFMGGPNQKKLLEVTRSASC